jgi:prepilin-type N-terminal cleavage/methylation domain-containing protein
MAEIKKQAGFTIVELLVSVLLTSIIMGAIYSVYRVQTHSAKVQENRLEAQEYARSVVDMMVREIRNAGYFPVTVTDVNCLLAQGGIVTADAQTIRFRLDADADGDCAGPNEYIVYTLSGSNITRAVDGGTAESLTDGNVTAFQLSYFPQNCSNNFSNPVGAGSASCPATAGANAGTLAAIQRVSISITVQSKNPDTEFGGQLNATMTSNADLRNRGLPS